MSNRHVVYVAGLLWLGTFFSTDVCAQPSSSEAATTDPFVEATLVTSTEDSLTGQVRWKEMAPTPEVVRFRSGPDDESVEVFHPQDLWSVRFADGRRLVGRAVELDQVPRSPKKANEYLKRGKPIFRPDTLFLEVVVTGALRLYTKQGARSRYFVASDGEMTELLKRRRYVESQGGVATSHQYRQQLSDRMAKCPDVSEDAAEVDFALRELKQVVARYNRCVVDEDAVDEDVYVQQTTPTFAISFGMMGGLTRSQLSMKNAVAHSKCLAGERESGSGERRLSRPPERIRLGGFAESFPGPFTELVPPRVRL